MIPKSGNRFSDKIMLKHAYPAERICRAAATMFMSAGLTSAQARVYSPQSGLTQSCPSDSRPRASVSRSAISSTPGTRGEWMS
jgi:hypothetical protein